MTTDYYASFFKWILSNILEYFFRNTLRKSRYSVRIRKNTDQKQLRICLLRQPQAQNVTLEFGYFLIILKYFQEETVNSLENNCSWKS